MGSRPGTAPYGQTLLWLIVGESRHSVAALWQKVSAVGSVTKYKAEEENQSAAEGFGCRLYIHGSIIRRLKWVQLLLIKKKGYPHNILYFFLSFFFNPDVCISAGVKANDHCCAKGNQQQQSSKCTYVLFFEKPVAQPVIAFTVGSEYMVGDV